MKECGSLSYWSNLDEDATSRLEALRDTGLLDSAPEGAFDRFTKLVSKLLGAPVALVTLIDANRQFFKSSVGLLEPVAAQRETPLSYSFCQYVVSMRQPLVVMNAQEHALVQDNPAVRELGLTAYAGVPVHAPDGHIIGALCAIDHGPRQWNEQDLEVLTDLAAALDAEIALRAAKREAEAASKAKSAFLSAMSHELRTPLSGVLGAMDLLDLEPLTQGQLDYVTAARNSAQHLLTIVNDILDFSRIESGHLQSETVDFSLSWEIENLRAAVAPLAAERALDLRFQMPESVPEALWGDPTRLRQVLLNLVRNAIRFTESGSVTFVVSSQPPQGGRTRFRFEVRDTGIGIPVEQQSRLFGAFAQGDRTTTRNVGGIGLGLAVSKRLVQAMGGEIGVDSTPGTGSLFWVEIPFKLGALGKPEREKLPTPSEIQPRRILIAEESELIRDILHGILSRQGHRLTLADNGAEALDLVQKEAFDLVLMNIQMPVMDGLEVTRRIRQLSEPARNIPIVALTANVTVHERNRYLAAGINECLSKPINWRQLFAAIGRYADSGYTSTRCR